MRSGVIIGVVVALAVVIGGVYWYNDQTEQALLEEQRLEEEAQSTAEETAEEDERLRREQAARESEARAEQAARERAETEASQADAEEAGVGDDDPMVKGDEITDGAIVVESTTDEAVILDPAETATTTRIIDDAESVDSTVTRDAASRDEVDGDATKANGADEIAETSAASSEINPEQLLRPANFDRDEVIALIDASDQLSAERRSTLRALAEGASANPAMVEPAIKAIRAALDLPAL